MPRIKFLTQPKFKNLIYTVYDPEKTSSRPKYCKSCKDKIEPGELVVKIKRFGMLCLECVINLWETQKTRVDKMKEVKEFLKNGINVRKIAGFRIIFYPAEYHGLLSPVHCKKCGEDITIGPRAISSRFYQLCLFCFSEYHRDEIEEFKKRKEKKSHGTKNQTK